MKKMIIFLIFLYACCCSAPHCLGNYLPAAQYIEKHYIKFQIEYALRNHIQFKYSFFPVTVFPLFCAKSVIDLNRYEVEYPCDTISVWKKNKPLDYFHLRMAVLSFSGNKVRPNTKTYTLYFLYLKPATGAWIEERSPLKVTLVLTDKKTGEYGCAGK
jgi:hypothetical protein